MGVEAGRADDAQTLVFINYRTDDAASAAAFLHAELSVRFGQDAVFLDYESIPLGQDFRKVLLSRVRRSAVLLVVVGDRWLDGELGQRPIDNADDWVRVEILAALEHGVPVVPVLFGKGKVIPERLPDGLTELSNFQWFQIHRRQRADIRALGDELVRKLPRLREADLQARSRAAGPVDGQPAANRARTVLVVMMLFLGGAAIWGISNLPATSIPGSAQPGDSRLPGTTSPPTTTSTATSTTSAHSTSPLTSTTTTTTSDEPELWRNQILLLNNRAIDLDEGKGRQVTPNTDGADIWLDNSRYSDRYLLTPLHGRIATWSGDSTPSSTRCGEVLDSASTGTAESTTDTIVCVETGSGNIVLMRVLEQRDDGVLLDVTRW